MGEVVFATKAQFEKAGDVFRSCDRFCVEEAPSEENLLAEAVTQHKCRAIVLGPSPYPGPALYEALGRAAEGKGAIIARFGVGHDGVDKGLCRKHGIIVTNTPGVLDISVAEHVFWMIGALARRLLLANSDFKSGQWRPIGGMELYGKVLGILGFGVIGRRAAAIGHRGFGMRVVAVGSRSVAQLEHDEGMPIDDIKSAYGIERYTTDADAALREADIVAIHLPLNDQTRHFIGRERLALMKPEAILINTARGPVVDESALYDALIEGRLSGAGLDVFDSEPYAPVDSEKDLRALGNTVLTPHVGSNTREANRRMALSALQNISDFLAGDLHKLSRVD